MKKSILRDMLIGFGLGLVVMTGLALLTSSAHEGKSPAAAQK